MLISAKDIITKSVELYRNNGKTMVTYAAILAIPTILMTLVALVNLQLYSTEINRTLLTLLYVLIVIALSVVGLWISIGLIKTIASLYSGTAAPPVMNELKAVVKYIWPAALASILIGLITLGGFILFIVPGVIFGIWFAFTIYAIILDDKKVIDSLHYSKQLVQGRWWSVLWRLLAPGIIFAVIIILIQWIIGIPFNILMQGAEKSGISYTILTAVYSIISVAISVLVSPLTTAAPTILYAELKNTMPKSPAVKKTKKKK